jgi:hypothetical protein
MFIIILNDSKEASLLLRIIFNINIIKEIKKAITYECLLKDSRNNRPQNITKTIKNKENKTSALIVWISYILGIKKPMGTKIKNTIIQNIIILKNKLGLFLIILLILTRFKSKMLIQ